MVESVSINLISLYNHEPAADQIRPSFLYQQNPQASLLGEVKVNMGHSTQDPLCDYKYTYIYPFAFRLSFQTGNDNVFVICLGHGVHRTGHGNTSIRSYPLKF